ncbi:hypothetical protein HYG87_05240 [Methanobacterium alkalithermotolerans]|uniref:PsbP C-terminal domain-containing protein n=1 Tax=Methanobacterium alkalithermotolerans TaxID=2731220 RepID=A0A8T8K6S7_9EURY|nr:PsbP-related protein [Methanobacterium alkalithermotolerans]QUH23215.1 hypothetical protein HYG87_05240 [Methanobacterium alkalithermotolerans]
MRKYFIALLVILFLVFTAGCTSNSDSRTNETITLTQNGVSFDYPGTWVVATSKANDTIASVADPRSVNTATGFAETVVTIQRINRTGTFNSMYDQNYATLFNNSSYQRVSESNITMGNVQARENVYTVDDNGILKQQRAIWIEDSNQIYVILCSALINQFERERQNFDLIVNSFKIIN